jgi:hypothetical protein
MTIYAAPFLRIPETTLKAQIHNAGGSSFYPTVLPA